MPPRVTSYMSSPVITARRNDNLACIRNLMIRHKIGKIVITEEDGETIYGIISKSDFIRILYNRKKYIKPLETLFAYEIATTPVLAVRDNRTIRAVAQIMSRRNIGSLLVLDKEQKLSGIITRADLVRAYAEKYHGKYEVRDFMNQSPPTVTLSHSIFYVIDLMNESGIGKVVVVDGGKPVGVITKSDVMFMNIENLLSGSRLKFVKKRGISGRGFESVIRMYSLPIAEDVMSQNPITVRPSEDLSVAADVMTKNRIGTLPVVDDKGVLVGLLTKHDILNALRQV